MIEIYIDIHYNKEKEKWEREHLMGRDGIDESLFRIQPTGFVSSDDERKIYALSDYISREGGIFDG